MFTESPSRLMVKPSVPYQVGRPSTPTPPSASNHSTGIPAPTTREWSASRSNASMLQNASTNSAAIHACGKSPMCPGLLGFRHAISGHWFHAGGRRSARKNCASSKALCRRPRRMSAPTMRISYGEYLLQSTSPVRRFRKSDRYSSNVPSVAAAGSKSASSSNPMAFAVAAGSISAHSTEAGT